MASRYQLSSEVMSRLLELGVTADEIMRAALKIDTSGFEAAEGLIFPEGTAFLTWYKERPHWGIVKKGAIEIEGERLTSVSGAAAKVTGRPTTNGWAFWLVKVPGKNEFTPIANFRKTA